MKLQNQETIKQSGLKEKARQEQKAKNKKRKIYRSFLTLVLFFCIIWLLYSAVLNIFKNVIYRSKIHKSLELNDDEREKNFRLRNELKNYTNSTEQIESIARNNLKMAGDNEILVIINKNQEEIKEPETFFEKVVDFLKKETER